MCRITEPPGGMKNYYDNDIQPISCSKDGLVMMNKIIKKWGRFCQALYNLNMRATLTDPGYEWGW